MQKKYESTINDYVYYESDKQVDTMSDSNKQVDQRNDLKEETHIVNRTSKLSVGLFNPAVIGVIGKELVTDVQENLRVELSLSIACLRSTLMHRRQSRLARHAIARRLIATLSVVSRMIGLFVIIVVLVPQP